MILFYWYLSVRYFIPPLKYLGIKLKPIESKAHGIKLDFFPEV